MDSIEQLLRPQSFLHIRITQRNARKTITSIEGLDIELDHDAILKALKKTFNCNGYIEDGILCLQGDHRTKVRDWFVAEEIKEIKERKYITIHGY